MERRLLYDPERVGLRVLSARPLHRRDRLAGVVVVASDINTDAGVAAVWLVRRAGPSTLANYCLFERARGSWQYLGCGGAIRKETFLLTSRPSASQAGPASMMTNLSGCSARSHAEREARDYQQDLAEVGWVACAMFRVAAEVVYLQVGTRLIKVPQHGHVIVAWKAPPSSVSPRRPPIAAVGGDGVNLTELGPDSHLDSLTWTSLERD